MNKSATIREFVRAHPGATVDAIAEATGLARGAFVQTVCKQRVKRGEFVEDSDGGFSINADFVLNKKGQGAAPRRERASGKKVRGNREHLRAVRRAKKKPRRTIADVARKHLAAPEAAVRLPAGERLARHVKTTMDAFAETVDMNDLSRLAWRSVCEAVDLLAVEASPPF